MRLTEYPAYYNGSFCQIQDLKVSILDLGLIHSDATYDVIAIKDREFVNLDAHLKRFAKSCYGWRIPLKYSKEDLELGLMNLQQGYLRLLNMMQIYTAYNMHWDVFQFPGSRATPQT